MTARRSSRTRPEPQLVLPLHLAENQFLQVLLPEVRLQRSGKSLRLAVEIDESAPAIWSRTGKRRIADAIPTFATTAQALQDRLDRFFADEGERECVLDDPGFPFRYASGGTLPIVRRRGRDYYCLFFREIDPIGWNIANGGCDSRHELLDPRRTIERELCEELFVVDPTNRRRYRFDWDAGPPPDRPEFATAWKLWEQRFPDLARFEQLDVPLKWVEGPDILDVRVGSARNVITGCYLNVNALDFGIELDRVGRLHLDDAAVLLEGELFGYDESLGAKLVGAPVGLFETESLEGALREGLREFRPDHFFYDGIVHGGDALDRVVDSAFWPRISSSLPPAERARFESCRARYDLCPATRQLVRRYVSTRPAPQRAAAPGRRVFLSHASEDETLASRVDAHLRGTGHDVFFSRESLHGTDFSRLIDDALDEAWAMVVVGSDPAHLQKRWVSYEWRTFHNDINNGLKPEASPLVSFIQRFPPRALPPALRYRQVVCCDSTPTGDDLAQVGRLLRT